MACGACARVLMLVLLGCSDVAPAEAAAPPPAAAASADVAAADDDERPCRGDGFTMQEPVGHNPIDLVR